MVLEPCTSRDVEKHKYNLVDRLSSLPDELLADILSLLSTEDAAAVSSSSTRLRRVLPLVTKLDFDASSIIYCVHDPYAMEKYPTFVNFVTYVLEAHHSEYLTSFRLKVVSTDVLSSVHGKYRRLHNGCRMHNCLPDLKFLQLSAWMSFPLSSGTLRVLDLWIVVREPGDTQLPSSVFTSQTLEVLKLELNIGLDQILAMPSYSLPRLKVLYFSVSFLSDDSFLPRLLASCPLLEDLTYQPLTDHVAHLIIKSKSLRRLCLMMCRNMYFDMDHIDYVCIETPNLEHFKYNDNIAHHYSIFMNSHCLIKAELFVWEKYLEGIDVAFQQFISLIAPLSHVRRLTLSGEILQAFEETDVNLLKDQLPVFPNMKNLSLGGDCTQLFWDKMLLTLLNCWPILETLVMKEGIIDISDRDYRYPKEKLELEQKFFRRSHPIPSCCRYHLKRIVIKDYLGKPRENDFIQFFLNHALVLETLIIHRLQGPGILPPDQILVETTLRSLPKASTSCLIRVL